MFNFEHTKLTQTQIEGLAQLLTRFKQCYATSKFDVGNVKVELKQQWYSKNKEVLVFNYNYKTEYNIYSIY